MTLWIATHHPEVILTIPLIKLGKPQSPMIQTILTMTKTASVPLAARITFDLTVAEMHLSLIN